MLQKLISLYGEEKGKETENKLRLIINQGKKDIRYEEGSYWSEKDVFLITYPDSFIEKNIPSLVGLKSFLDKYLKGIVSNVHVLPFFPYSSDRGFSVVDFNQVKHEFGTWEDIENIGKNYRIMADLVLNHVSTESFWFQEFLKGNPKFTDYFISFSQEERPKDEDIKKIFRSRATPVLTRFKTNWGDRLVWTTFSVEKSTDQVDLNYKNPEVLIEIVKVVLNFIKKGVRIIRLDAAPFVWKELGTNCFNLPQAHMIVKILRQIVDEVCPATLIITQASTSHEENVAYFGDGQDEAEMVYNFSLPPLVLFSFLKENATHLTAWAKILKTPSDKTTFFNFLAVHDGIGLSGAEGILNKEEEKFLCDTVLTRGGLVSEKTLPSGEKKVYEINSTYWSALNKEEEPFVIAKQKFITAIAVSFALAGIPAVYYNMFFGSKDDQELFHKTSIKRDLNRQNFNLPDLQIRLSDSSSNESKVFAEVKDLIKRRINSSVFHPNAKQEILDLDHRVFALVRENEKTGERILCLHNVSGEKVVVECLGKTYTVGAYGYVWESI